MSLRSRQVNLLLALTAGLALGSNPNYQPFEWLNNWVGGSSSGQEETPLQKSSVKPELAPSDKSHSQQEQEFIFAAERQMFDDHGRLVPGRSPTPQSSAASPVTEENRSPVEEQFLTGLRMPDMPVSRDPKIVEYLQFFTRTDTGRTIVGSWLERRDRYQELFRAALAQRSLPSSLEAVALIESSLYKKAVSPAGAGGLWQLMPATARAYGLTVKKGNDERFDPSVSTAAAVQHLSDLYRRFESWELTLAAYNAGTPAIESRLRRHRADNFWQLANNDHLPRETALYVPKVLAVAIILQNLELFDFLSPEESSPYSPTPLTPRSRPSFSPAGHFSTLNGPHTARQASSNWGYESSDLEDEPQASYALLIDRHTGKMHSISKGGQPKEIGDTFAARSPQLAFQDARPAAPAIIYKVKPGDALEAIARRHHVAVSDLVDWNHIRDPGLLRTGLKLRIFQASETSSASDSSATSTSPDDAEEPMLNDSSALVPLISDAAAQE